MLEFRDDFNKDNPEPGIYRNVPMPDYIAADAMSSSGVRSFLISPASYRFDRDAESESSSSAALGTAIHTLAIDGVLAFREAYEVEPDPVKLSPKAKRPRQTKAYQDAVAKIRKSGKDVLTTEDWDTCTTACDSIFTHPTARMVRDTATDSELTVIWDAKVGDDSVICKARFDWVGETWFADLKTTPPASFQSPVYEREIQRLIGYRQLHVSAAWYSRAFFAAYGYLPRDAFYLYVRRGRGCEREVVSMTQEAMDTGYLRVDNALREFVVCREAGDWPAGSDEVIYMDAD